MIVSCPNCCARYRIPEGRIPERGARITCPACSHRFTVHSGDHRMVVGGDAEPRGLNVLGNARRPAGFDEEDDQPTTIMTAEERNALAREATSGAGSRPPAPPPPPDPAPSPVAAPADRRPPPTSKPPTSRAPGSGATRWMVLGALVATVVAAVYLMR